MTTLQPRLVRADTLDLQSHDSPSAKDHTRSPTYASFPHGATGPHHREALRHAEESAYHDNRTSPRASMDDGSQNHSLNGHPYDSTDDDGDEERNDATNTEAHNEGDYEEGNDEAEDDLDDDMMDKISSSPSIEDGKYSCSVLPPRLDIMDNGVSCPHSSPSSVPTRGSIPYASFPSSYNFPRRKPEALLVSHHLNGSLGQSERGGYGPSSSAEGCTCHNSRSGTESMANVHPSAEQSDCVVLDDIVSQLLPAYDPYLNDDPVDNLDGEGELEWVDEGEPWYDEESSSDDDSNNLTFTDDSRFIDSGWGGECLREIEDIDFEFVYALHTFVATVEGQANATKGDTMVLLDDSNSYWWLVRVVKDGSIGYLPAEHIETPTERLARLNKHRNIDLSASMLGDNPEKSKNPLKKAMRRRNAKSVAFAAPTYYEPSEYEYSTDEEDDGQQINDAVDNQQQHAQQSEVADVQDESQLTGSQEVVMVNGIKNSVSDDQSSASGATSPIKTEAPEQALAQAPSDESMQRSRNGVVRNTDSFFKDDSVETKKISLTPRLLRNDTDSTGSSDAALRAKTSAETFEKMLGPEEKVKEKEKKKEKKGMLSGLFKRKDKSAKANKNEVEDEKADDALRTHQTKESLDSIPGPQSPERKPSKLQKQPPGGMASKTSPTDVKAGSKDVSAATSPVLVQGPHSPARPSDVQESQEMYASHTEVHRAEQAPQRFPSLTEKRSIFAPITTVLKPSPSHANDGESNSKPIFSKRAKERFAIDTSDSEDDVPPQMSQPLHDNRAVSPIQDDHLDNDRPDSAMEVSPVEPSDNDSQAQITQPVQRVDSDVVGEHEILPRNIRGTPQSDTASTSKPSPSLATHTPSTSRSTPTWSDASLRSYMENDQDIRDLLIIVHDKSNITPVGPDHPLMGGMFLGERTRLAEMQSQLDSMLTSWISRKTPALLAKGA